MPDLSKREQNKLDTRARIIAAAADKFLTQGVEESTVSEIARQAGVSRGTFFNYFPTKDSVLNAMWEDMASRFSRMTSRQLDTDATTRERVVGVFRNFANAAEREPDYMHLVSGEMNRVQTSGDTPLSRADLVTDHLVAIIESGQSTGEVRTDYGARFLAQMVTAGYVSAIMQWREKPKLGVQQEFAAIAEFVADAIEPRATMDQETGA